MMRFVPSLVVLSIAVAVGASDPGAEPGRVIATLPDEPAAGPWLVYLHGAIVEGEDARPVHPRWGRYEFPGVAAALAGLPGPGERPWAVWADHRPAGLDLAGSVGRLTSGIERLLAAGVREQDIVVVGHSRGGAIALQAAATMGRPGLRFAILAGCFPSTQPDLEPRGRVLSLLDASDELAVSCRPWISEEGAEEVLEVGGGHGLFYRPDPCWLGPLGAWLGEGDGAT